MKQYDMQGTLDQAFQMVDECTLGHADATEWVVIHSQLLDEESGRCAMSPPMLAMDWGVAKTVLNSLIEAAITSRSSVQDQCWLARLEDEPDSLRIGIFDDFGERVPATEIFLLMDKRKLTQKVYHEMYVKSATGTREVREMPFPEPPKKPMMH
ncbi:hypothetical protein KS527_004496 [Salmonella enterica]|nr:hypothetical protein [Salmonella enterica]